MLTHSNIDRSDSVSTSPAPFTYNSTCTLNGIKLGAGSFISLKVYSEKNYRVPYRMHSITADGRVWFCDATGKPCIYWQTYPLTDALTDGDTGYVSSVLYNTNDIIAGHVCCVRTVIDILRNIIADLQSDLLLPADAFVLIPQCHIPMLTGACRVIYVNGKPMTSDVVISVTDVPQVTAGVITEYTNETITIHLTQTVEELTQEENTNTICRLVVVNGGTGSMAYDCAGKNIVIKATQASNLRVCRENDRITLKGVTDA